MQVDVPDGLLKKLLLAHIIGGRQLMTLERAVPSNRLFVNDRGRPFNDSTFDHYWQKAMTTAAPFGLKYFPPSKARTIFVEEYTSVHNEEPDMWDGAAALMGNSVEQWRATYNPSRKRRLAQMAADYHLQPRNARNT